MKGHRKGKVLLGILILLVLTISSCEESEDNLPKYSPPADHTVSQDGTMHKSGFNDPLTNCVSCHGADLKGGSTGVSCYECHGKEW